MNDYNSHFTPATEEEYYRPRNKGRRFLFAVILMAIGGITLGAGIGAGYAFMQNITPEPIAVATSPPTQDITTVRINPLAIPISPQETNIADIVPLVKDSVVSINIIGQATRPFGGGAPGSGSGFIFHRSSEYVYIATNNHVIENAVIITISLDDTAHAAAHVVGTDPDSDLAVIAVSLAELEEKGVPFIVAHIGDSGIMRMGDTVLAIGNAMGAGQTVTLGIVSALDLTIDINDPNRPGNLRLNVMQTDAAVNRGNSGGPLVNQHGEVIAVVTAKQMGNNVEGMGYALPINEAMEILQQLKSEGAVRQPFIGIGHDPITEFMRGLFNLPYSGILIRSVGAGTPAAAAGLQIDDMLIYLNGVRLYTFEIFVEELHRHRPGDQVTFGVFRNGEHLQVDLVLGAAPR